MLDPVPRPVDLRVSIVLFGRRGPSARTMVHFNGYKSPSFLRLAFLVVINEPPIANYVLREARKIRRNSREFNPDLILNECSLLSSRTDYTILSSFIYLARPLRRSYLTPGPLNPSVNYRYYPKILCKHGVKPVASNKET